VGFAIAVFVRRGKVELMSLVEVDPVLNESFDFDGFHGNLTENPPD
jgi:hypothetical protein